MAYDIAANQILAQPVTAYYKGRALRLAEKRAEQEGNALDTNIQISKRQDQRAQELHDIKLESEQARQIYEATGKVIEQGESAKSYVERTFPEIIPELEKSSPGFSWKDASNQDVLDIAAGMRDHASVKAHIGEEAYTLGPGQVRFKGGEPIAAVKDSEEKSPDDIRKYEYAVSQGYKGSFMDFHKERKGKGISMTMPDGTVVQIGGDGGAVGAEELAKPTINKLQETIVAGTDRLDRLNLAMENYNPEFLRLSGISKVWGTKLKDFAGLDVSDEERVFLQQAAAFTSQMKTDLNKMLNELSGAAVTEHEMKRLKQGSPSGDEFSPAEFESKFRATVKGTTRAIMRANWALKNGIGVKSVKELSEAMPLESIDAVYEQRANEIWQEMGGEPEMKAEAIRKANKEFGLGK